jgi:NAD(P)H-hydrate epimerase
MKILSAQQTRKADAHTIQTEPISSLNLMERAAKRATYKLLDLNLGTKYHIMCGQGNNGGDGLVMARYLAEAGQTVVVTIVEHSKNPSEDFKVNAKRLAKTKAEVVPLASADGLRQPEPKTVVVDALLGSGLDRPLEGLLVEVCQTLNSWPNPKVAVDLPTGLFADINQENDLQHVLKVDYTLTFQHPKLSLLNAFTAPHAGEVCVINIGLDPKFYKNAEGHAFFVEKNELAQWYKPRPKFGYKNSYGHAYLVAGSEGKIGAALLASESAMRSGVGLLTLNGVAAAEASLNVRLPAAMFTNREAAINWSTFSYQAMGLGPGLGTHKPAQVLLKQTIQNYSGPTVLDADALNILAQNKTWLSFLNQKTVLTPHVGEFKRLLGVKKLTENYPKQLRGFAQHHRVYVLLKDTISILASPSGQLFYCDFGSPALATAGTGDVLTGIILGLLAQGYPVYQAVLLGVYLHGTAAKKAAEASSAESVIASDVSLHLGAAFATLR